MDISIQSLVDPGLRIATAQPDDHMGSALKRVESSHDPVLVFDGENLLGVVSTSYALFHKRFPHTAKISSATITPPHITENDSIFEVAEQMVSTRLYALPVFDDSGKMMGFVTARAILERTLKNKNLTALLQEKISPYSIESVGIHAKVGEIYQSMRKERTSRVVTVDEKGQLTGIVTRRDLQEAFLAPSRRERFGKIKGRSFRSIHFDEEEIRRFDFPIGEFKKRDVVTAPEKTPVRTIFKKMVNDDVNSVVLVDQNQKPKGIVSIRSFLTALASLKPSEKIQVKLSDKHKVITRSQEKQILSIIGKYAKKLDKMDPLRLVEVSLDSYRNINGKTTAYEIHTRVHLQNGKGYMTKIEEKRLTTAVRNSFKKILSQEK